MASCEYIGAVEVNEQYTDRNLFTKLVIPVLLLAAMLLGNTAFASEQVITGTIHRIWGDPPPTSGQAPILRFVLTADQGMSVPLAIDEKLLKAKGGARVLSGKRVSIKGRWGRKSAGNGGTVFEVESIAVEPSPNGAVAPGAALTGPQPWVTILCRFADSTGVTPHPVSWFDTLMGTTPPGMDHYWQELSYNNISLSGSTVVGWYNLPDPISAYLSGGIINFSKSANDCANAADADVQFPDFGGINFMFNQTIGCCAWGGSAYITADGGGSYSTTWMPPWGYQAHGVLAQEMGHGFGLMHSSGPYSTPYDSDWDPMSNGFGSCAVPDPNYGCIGVHTISYHKDIMGWIPPANKVNVAPIVNQDGVTPASLTVNLERLGQPTNSTDFLMAQVPIGGSTTDFYTVEARRSAGGYDANIPGDAVVIHKVDTNLSDRNAQVVDATNNGNPNDAGAMWTVGETFTDSANGITITVNSDTGTGFNVSIVNGAGGTPGIVSPTAGSTLPGSTVTFQWTANGAVVERWELNVGSSLGGYDLFASRIRGTGLSETVMDLPTDGRQIYVRLWYLIGGSWQFSDFQYTAAL